MSINKTFKEEVLQEFDDKHCIINDSGHNELSVFSTRPFSIDTDYTKNEFVFVAEEIKTFINSALDLYKKKILEALTKEKIIVKSFCNYCAPGGGGVNCHCKDNEKGYDVCLSEVKQIIENI